MGLPILDKKPSGKPHDWSYKKILAAKEKEKERVERPRSWKNPNAHFVAPRDQAFRGTCVGQSTAYCYDMLYIKLTGEKPTSDDIAQYKKDVIDSLGTTHDVLYPQSASAESFYQKSREIGNITYPAGSETRFAARAWIQWGMCLEKQWHTDKTGKCVWDKVPRKTVDGGLSPAEAANFAEHHRATGWALVGDEYGNATFDEICDAIYQKGFVLAGIPVYENYNTMQSGDGAFPEPRGNIVGYHALCYYGFDEDTLYLLHSWGDFCSMFGSVSKEYTNSNTQESVYLVVLDDADVKIARDNYKSLTVSVKDSKTKLPLLATISIDNVPLGISPQTFATESGKTYIIGVVMEGYNPSKTNVSYVGQSEEVVYLDALPNQKSWWMKFIDWLISIFHK